MRGIDGRGSVNCVPGQRQSGPIVGAAVSLAAVIALSAFAAVSYVSANRWVDHALDVRQAADEWTIALLDAATIARESIRSDPPVLRSRLDAAVEEERARSARMRRLVADSTIQMQNVDAAGRDALAALAHLRALVALVDGGRRAEGLLLLQTGEGQRLVDVFRGDARHIVSEEGSLLVERRSRVDAWALAMGVGCLLLVASSIGFLGYAWSLQRVRGDQLDQMAADARRRLDALADVASALAETRSQSEVVKAALDHGVRAVGADVCALYRLDETGKVLELIGERGIAAEVAEKIRRFAEASDDPGTFAALQSSAGMWAESESDCAALFPALSRIETQGPRAGAFWSLPLIVEGRHVGVLGMGFYQARSFPPDEREFVATLAKQCAQALERAAHLEREEETRQWFGTTLRSIGDAVIATDGRGCVIFMNDVAEALTGWTVGEARRHSLDDVFCIFSERTRKAAESPVAKVLREGKVVGLANHTVLRSRRGVETPIDDSAAPIRDEGGRLLGVVLVFRDATAKKREEVRREFLARAGEVLSSSLDYPTTLAAVAQFAVPELADWCVVDLVEPGSNAPRQVAMAHADPSKVQFARELGQRYPPDPNATTGAPEVIRTGKSELYTEIPDALLDRAARDAEHARLLRQLRLESAMVVPLRGHSRTLGAMSFIYADSGRRYRESDLAFAQDFARRATLAIENATAMKAVEEARVREHALRREAEVASQTKDEFLATVSHELRTPLNAILGWTVLLRARKMPPELDHPLSIIERNARAQTKLIEDILDLSRIISGKLALNLGPTNLAATIQASVETVTPAAEAKDIRIATDIADVSTTITADADRLQQVVWNLLTNAVKFTPKGGEVFVRTYREDSDVCISVRDTGEGIPWDALPFVFDRFQQADASTTRRHGGLGLGLAIVKQLVTAHGGTVRAMSEGQGKGATFVVQMPARPSSSAVNVTDGHGKTAAVVPGQPVTRLDGLRLLVIEDEDDARMLVGEVLKHQGADVHLAASVAEGLEMFSAVKPDVVVSDIGMPQMDGYSLIRKIRELSPALGGQTPAIALTAYARREDANRAFAAGYQSHVAKPVEPETLARLVASLSGRRESSLS